MKRPLLLVGLLYVGGILVAEEAKLPPTLLLGFLATLTFVAIGWARWRPALLYFVIFLFGSTNLSLQKMPFSRNDLRNILSEQSQIVTVRGRLLETPDPRQSEIDDRITWHTQTKLEVNSLRPDRGAWRPASGNIVISTRAALTNLFAGQMVEVTGRIAPPSAAIAEGLFDYRDYLARLGYYFELFEVTEKDWIVISLPRSPPLADKFRSWGRQALSLGSPREDESLRLEWALTLGWKPALTPEVSEPFIRAATYHIFAVDGLRMAIIFGIFFGLLRALSIPRSIIGILLVPLLWFYVALTGWPASAIRATVMLTIVILGWVLHRPGELINSLFAAALIILIWQPQQLFQAGFQLSFFVVLCIILTVPLLHRWGMQIISPDPLLPTVLHRRWPRLITVPARYFWDVLITSFAAWIGSLPLVAYYFNIVSPISTPANLVAVPLCALVLISNLTSLLLASWLPAAAIIFNHAGWFLMECIRVSSRWFAAWPKAYAYVAAPSLFAGLLYYALLIAIVTGWLFRPAWRRTKLGAVAVLLLLWAGLALHDWGMTRLTILPLNGATGIFFDPPGTADDLLIDCGQEYSVKGIVTPFLRARGVDRLSNFAVTHGETRIMGGAELLKTSFAIDRIYASPVPFRSPDYKKFLEQCRDGAGKLLTVQRGDKVGSWRVLHPEAVDHFPRADDKAMVLATKAGPAKILLLSELGDLGESALREREATLRADIVITGLPGRGEPLSDVFLDGLKPQLIVVTDHERPVQQRASKALQERLTKRNIPIIYLRSSGTVVFEFRKSSWKLRSRSGVSFPN